MEIKVNQWQRISLKMELSGRGCIHTHEIRSFMLYLLSWLPYHKSVCPLVFFLGEKCSFPKDDFFRASVPSFSKLTVKQTDNNNKNHNLITMNSAVGHNLKAEKYRTI